MIGATLTAGVRMYVEAWDPGYGAAVDSAQFAAGAQSTAELDCDVELPAGQWRPVEPAAGPPPEVVLLVDGVRRIDARLWLGDDRGVEAALAGSFAAGVVRCDLRRRTAEVVLARVARGIFSPWTGVAELTAGTVRYPLYPAAGADLTVLTASLQRQLQRLEASVCADSRDEASADELLVADGPLRGREGASRMLGYIKSQEKTYLPASLGAVLPALRAGQRSPVFLLGTRWRQYTWYLRLPGASRSPWGNLVRVECSADLPAATAVELADASARTLPRFAATAHKDPRAPQNLTPIAGLERRLRGMLGDARLLHRVLCATATAGSSPAGDAR
jgi:hypothetical protein